MSCSEAMKKYNQVVAKLPTFTREKELSLEEKIRVWLVTYIAKVLKIESDEVNSTVPFERYALGSADSTILVSELGAWLERNISATALYNYPNIELLAKHLASSVKVAA